MGEPRSKGIHEFISAGNGKTGDTGSFDLPPVSHCPGKTELCARLCYAVNMCGVYKGVAAKYERNASFAESPEFARYMIRMVPVRGVFRIHVSGDFYSVDYVRKWIQIATRRSDVVFYCYTRSWRDRAIWAEIRKLGALPNVTVNVSCDRETGKPKETANGFRWAYMAQHDSEKPTWLRRQDIVFRTNHNARQGGHQWKRKKAIERDEDPDVVAPLMHRVGKAPVCPVERGQKMVDFPCSRCTICMRKPA